MHGYEAADLANAFRTVRKNTIQVAEDIPEDKYNFVPAPGIRPVNEVLAHIAYSPMMQDDMHRVAKVTTLAGYNFGAIIGKTNAEAAKLKSKSEIIAALTGEGEKTAKWLESLTPEFLSERVTDPFGTTSKSRFESLMGMKEHEMHHRAQLMLVQRLIGVVPHLTRQREERQRANAAPATK